MATNTKSGGRERAKALLAPSAHVLKGPAPRKLGRPAVPAKDRFWSKIDTSAGVNACHPWTASIAQVTGYPQFWSDSHKTGRKTMRPAHQVAWELANNRPVPAGKIVLHAIGCCKACCNPRHLRTGSHKENAADRIAEGRNNRRLSSEQLARIVELSATLSPKETAAIIGCDPSTVRRILRGASRAKDTGIAFHRKPPGRPAGSKRVSSVSVVSSAFSMALH